MSVEQSVGWMEKRSSTMLKKNKNHKEAFMFDSDGAKYERREGHMVGFNQQRHQRELLESRRSGCSCSGNMQY